MTMAVVLSEAQARSLTERIRKAGEDFGSLLLEAHEGRAWELLGYATWQDYVAGEFTFTRGRSYQLLAQAKVTRLVGGPVTDREVRHMSTMVDTPIAEQPSAAVQRLLAEQRTVPKPAGHRQEVRGLDGLIASARSLEEKLTTVAEERTAEDALPADLSRVLRRLVSTIEGVLW